MHAILSCPTVRRSLHAPTLVQFLSHHSRPCASLNTPFQQTLEHILGYLNPRELASLEATCSFFIKSNITERVAMHFLSEIPRAKGLKPFYYHGESAATLLEFITGQSAAAAQGTAVSLGSYHTIALLKNTRDPSAPNYALYTMGRGFHGQLGNNQYEDALEPVRINEIERHKKLTLYQGKPDDINLAVVAAGSSHSASISRRGELYTWGLASSGELGHGGWTPIEVSVPRVIATLNRTRVVSVCAGASHTLAISEAGQLWTCGRGRYGQLGHGHFHDEGILVLVEAIRHQRIVSATAGKGHSMALAADGKLFTWGDARRGQLGHPQIMQLLNENDENGAGQPIALPIPQPIASLEPTKLRPPNRVTAIAAGGDHSMAVTVGGELLAFGCNKYGQLGTGDGIDRYVPTSVCLSQHGQYTFEEKPLRAMQVQCGASHTIVLVQNRGKNEVKAAGDNSYGQLGLGDRHNRPRFYTVKGLDKERITCISAGSYHNAAVTQGGALYTWGRGDCGQLGHGDDCNRWAPKLVQGFQVVHPDRTLRRNKRPALRRLLLAAPTAEKEERRKLKSGGNGLRRPLAKP